MWHKFIAWFSSDEEWIGPTPNGIKVAGILILLWIGYGVGYSRAERYYSELLWARMSETERDAEREEAALRYDPAEEPYYTNCI